MQTGQKSREMRRQPPKSADGLCPGSPKVTSSLALMILKRTEHSSFHMISFTSRMALEFKRNLDIVPSCMCGKSAQHVGENSSDLPMAVLPGLWTQAPDYPLLALCLWLRYREKPRHQPRRAVPLLLGKKQGTKDTSPWAEPFSHGGGISWFCPHGRCERSGREWPEVAPVGGEWPLCCASWALTMWRGHALFTSTDGNCQGDLLTAHLLFSIYAAFSWQHDPTLSFLLLLFISLKIHENVIFFPVSTLRKYPRAKTK